MDPWFIHSCRELAKDFVVSGTASESLYGACESMFKADMVIHYLPDFFCMIVYFFFSFQNEY